MESITPVSRPRFASIAAFLHHLNIRAAPRCDGSGGVAEFSIGVGGQVLTVREQRSKRDAMAAPRAAWESVGRATENAAAFGGRCRWESVRSTTLATLDEQSRCRVGPKNLARGS